MTSAKFLTSIPLAAMSLAMRMFVWCVWSALSACCRWCCDIPPWSALALIPALFRFVASASTILFVPQNTSVSPLWCSLRRCTRSEYLSRWSIS